jgi:hypothetical protein
MKALLRKITGAWICCLVVGTKLFAQDEKPELMLSLRHFTENNSVQYLKVQAQLKANNKLQALKDVAIQVYLDTTDATHLVSSLKTDEKGSAQTVVPASLKDTWASSPAHKFIAVAKATPKDEPTITELEIAKSKMEVDTVNADGTRSVTAKVFAYSNGVWIPTKGVEVKIGVERLGGSLKIGEEESYTTDSVGEVTVEFKVDSLPAGDAKGNIILIARVEDNEQFGDLAVEKTVPWGKYYQHINTFGQRSLSAARFRAPLWLLFMAYSIVISVWSVIIYLFVQIARMKRMGNKKVTSSEERAVEEAVV